MFSAVFGESILKIAQKKKKLSLKVHNLRDWTHDRHRTADDKPYGGGSGMVMKVEPIWRALRDLLGGAALEKVQSKKKLKTAKIILLSPKGKRFDQQVAKRLSSEKRIILICGHYEGVDERVREFITDEISIGDYILTGGELPAMVVVDALARLIPGVLGDSGSLSFESFENDLLEYPQYTRPRVFEEMEVPEVLTKGNHGEIEKWRKKKAIEKTKKLRKDLLNKKRRSKT